jgi:hypothetical protein
LTQLRLNFLCLVPDGVRLWFRTITTSN